MVTAANKLSRMNVGIIIVIISTIGSIIVSKITTSAQADSAFADFKVQTMGDISGLKVVNAEINKHLDNIDKNLENRDLQFQSLTSYLLNKK